MIRLVPAPTMLAAPAGAQGTVFDPAPVRACLDATPAGETAPGCIRDASNASQDAARAGSATVGSAACPVGATAEWTRLLDVEYGELADTLETEDGDGVSGSGPDRSGALREAQTAWTAFRDAGFALLDARRQDATIRNIFAPSCTLGMTARRTFELRDRRDDAPGTP